MALRKSPARECQAARPGRRKDRGNLRVRRQLGSGLLEQDEVFGDFHSRRLGSKVGVGHGGLLRIHLGHVPDRECGDSSHTQENDHEQGHVVAKRPASTSRLGPPLALLTLERHQS